MKNKLLLIGMLLGIEASAQLQGSIEQLYYFEGQGQFSMGPILKLQNAKNWYAEARYNYEEYETFSFYVGHAFENSSLISYSIVPIFGGVVGRFKGGSAGLNLDVEYKNFFLCSQSQYSFSSEAEIENFFFSWSELGYQPLPWLYGGVAVQPLHYLHQKNSGISPGVFAGSEYKNWTASVYTFNPLDRQRTFVISIIKSWGGKQ